MRVALVALFALAGCNQILGVGDPHLVPGDDAATIDADPSAPDAHVGPDAAPPPDSIPSCTAASAQCDNCIDDDGDGKVDGFDPDCTQGYDNDEGSFDDGVPGSQTRLDCQFDGNSGAGDDGCDAYSCCTTAPGSCSGNMGLTCAPSQPCHDECGPVTPPGCDCYGCCTVCDAGGCVDITIAELTSPDCASGVLHDPAMCHTCVKTAECMIPCGGACPLCPGQGTTDLPGACGGVRDCPNGETVCAGTVECAADQWCANGCCIARQIP